MKKFTLLTILFIVIIIIQNYLINGKTLFGVTPNLIIVFIVILNINLGIYKGCIFSFVIGIFCDLLYGSNIWIYTLSYSLIACLIYVISINQENYNKFYITILIGISTVSFEIIKSFIYVLNYNVSYSFIYLVYQSVIAAIYNVAIGFVIYNIFFNISNRSYKKKKSNYYIGGVRN